MAIFRQKPPNRGGIECRCGRQKSQFSTNIWLSIVDCWSANNNCDGRPCSLPHRAPRISESMFITTSMDDHDEEKRREQNLIVRSRKSEAEVTSIRILRSMYCAIEASYWQTRRIARPLRPNFNLRFYSPARPDRAAGPCRALVKGHEKAEIIFRQ